MKIAQYLQSRLDTLEENAIPTIEDDQTSEIELWKILFGEIKTLFVQMQFSVTIRKSTLEAVDEILEKYSDCLNHELWSHVLESMVLKMYEKSVDKYIEQLGGFSTTKAREVKQRETATTLATPTFSLGGGGGAPPSGNKKAAKKAQGRRMKFDEEAIQQFHQRNADDEIPHHEHGAFGMAPEETPKSHNKPSKANIEDQNV